VGDKPKFKDMNNNLGDLNQLLIPLLGDLYGWGKSFLQKITKPGMYEVLNYETILEILDAKGKNAILTKTEEVRFLQNNIIAFQDQAWGSGKILIDYKCKPGIPVDFYQFAHKTYIVISLRNVMKKGDITKFDIGWKIKKGFRESNGFWSTDINHFTKVIKINVIFPKERPPLKCSTVGSNRQVIKEIPIDAIVHLPDKRWQVTWEKQNPKLYEHYVLKWEW
jgi:hypothetical protein